MTDNAPEPPDELGATTVDSTVDSTVDAGDESPARMIVAEKLDLGTGELQVFGGLDFEVPVDSLAVITGSAGAGKSVLLAAMVGRFTGLRGRLEVAGLSANKQSRRLRKITTAARIGTFVDLEPKHSITNAVAERAAVEGLLRAEAVEVYERLTESVELDLDPGRLIEDLDGYQRTTLTIVLGLLRPSRVLVLDDVHRDLTIDDQCRLLTELVSLSARTSTTIVVSSVETTTIPYDAVRIALPTPGTARTTSSR